MKKYKLEIFIILTSLIFSTWLMFSSFSYDNGFMQISTKSWSDFASHIPLIRSFSFGENFIPQYPLFSGPIIKYHFLFYFLVGMLEKIGLRIDYALNIPSILGFSFLILMIYFFAKEIFKSRITALLSVCFFLFNSSLDFINFFIKYPLSFNTLKDIFYNRDFISFGPYDGSIISAFWNLNIYTNQRHLGLSYAFSLLFIFILFKINNYKIKYPKAFIVLIGILLGISFLLNMAVFLMTNIIAIIMMIAFKEKRVKIFTILSISSIIALPQYLFINLGGTSVNLSIHIGYLINNLSFSSFFNYWLQNLGLNLLLIPFSLLICNKNQRKYFISFLSLFIIANIFQFSPEIAANHKFFNLFIIIGGMYSAYFIHYLYKNKSKLRPIIPLVILIMTLSGIIDFFPIYNDNKIPLSDYPINKDASWIINNTRPDAVFLNTNYLYDNASLAGRKIFLGWPYFAWSQGYDTLTRDNLRKSLLNTNDLVYFCDNIKKYKLSFAEINKNIDKDIAVNNNFFEKNFKKVYKNINTNSTIYSLNTCR